MIRQFWRLLRASLAQANKEEQQQASARKLRRFRYWAFPICFPVQSILISTGYTVFVMSATLPILYLFNIYVPIWVIDLIFILATLPQWSILIIWLVDFIFGFSFLPYDRWKRVYAIMHDRAREFGFEAGSALVEVYEMALEHTKNLRNGFAAIGFAASLYLNLHSSIFGNNEGFISWIDGWFWVPRATQPQIFTILFFAVGCGYFILLSVPVVWLNYLKIHFHNKNNVS